MERTRTELIAVVGLIFCVGTPLAHASSLEDGLIAWWRMELKVGKIIPDASGNCHDLTVNGAPTFEDSIVIFNDDGTLEAADSDALDLLGDWSVSFWVREDAITGNGNGWLAKIRNFGDSEGGWSFVSGTSSFRNSIFNGFGINCGYDTSGPLPLGTWTRMTTTYDDATMLVSIYINDNLEFQNVIPTVGPVSGCSVLANAHPVVLGGFLDTDLTRVPDCNGAMSDIRIYDRTLCDSEVLELFAMGSPEDSDGDDVPNEEDDCPDSDLDATIVIAECDSGVENEMLDDGCTMADLIMQSADGAVNHGAFVRCVSHLANLWKCQGLINGQQKGAIMSCAGQADLP